MSPASSGRPSVQPFYAGRSMPWPSPVPAIGTPLNKQPTGTISGGPWVQVFGDEFDDPHGTGKPDWTIWADHMIPGDTWRVQNNANEVQWYTHDHRGESVSGSVLSLTARHESPTAADPLCPVPMPNGATGTYTSGMIQSHPGFQFTYGFTESRIRNAQGHVTGWWPAQWQLSAAATLFPEIDTYEYEDQFDQIDSNYWDTNGTSSAQSFVTDALWHTYGMRLDPAHVTFFLDGTQYMQVAYDGIAYPWFLIINAAVKNTATGTGFPVTLEVDYMRVWVPSGVPAQPHVTSLSPVNGVPSAGTLTAAFDPVAGATNYRATACPVDSGTTYMAGSHTLTASGSSGPLTVSGLTNGTKYSITVGAQNATGWGIESLPSPYIGA